MSDNIISKLTTALGDDVRLFESGPVSEVLGIVVDDHGGGGGGDDDGSNGDGTYTARDKEHAHQLLGEGYQGNDAIDASKALAGREGLRVYATALYNTNSRLQSIHARLMHSDGRDMEHFPLEDYNATPGVHHLIKEVVESMDLNNPKKRASVILFGSSGISKSGLLKSIVGETLGQGGIEVNGVEQIASIVHAIGPKTPLLLEDFQWTNTTNGSVVPIECAKGCLGRAIQMGRRR